MTGNNWKRWTDVQYETKGFSNNRIANDPYDDDGRNLNAGSYNAAGQIFETPVDGDGRTDAAIFRKDDPTTGSSTFYIRRSDGSFYTAPFGNSTDVPTSGDFDGDGRSDAAVWRDGTKTFYSLNSSNGVAAGHTFTQNSSEPVPADYDGDGKADYAVRETGTNNWVIFNSGSSTATTVAWQNSGDKSVQNDYDGDGKCDIAVWRDSNGTWYIRPSSNTATTRTVQWGASGDTPEPAYFRR
jgi:hypothetical protein